MNKKNLLLLLVIVFISFILRLYRINSPLADWHSWRQADTAAVSRNFIKSGFDVLHPRFDDLSNIPSGSDNPEGYRFVEFPIYNLIQATLALSFPIFSLEVWGRLVSIICSLISLIFLYLIVESLIDSRTALLSALFFSVLPYNIYYSRVILPEPMMVMLMLGSILLYIKYQKLNPADGGANQKLKILYYFLSILFAAGVILIKPFAVFIIFPSAIYLFLKEKKEIKFSSFKLLFYLIVSCLPFLLWRWWAGRYPEGIPANLWLLNAGGLRLRPAWFRWLFAERLAKLILGYWGVVFFALGIIIRVTKKEGFFFFSWLLGSLAYLIIVARGNIQHDYYQTILIPVVCLFLAKGADYLLFPSGQISRTLSRAVFTLCFIFSIGFSWYHVKDYFNINNNKMIVAGRRADQILPASAKVIAPLGGDTAFLYQVNRQGWPQGIEIDKLILKGASHYVNFNFGPETEYIENKFCVLEKNADYIIAKLSTCNR